MKKTLMSKLRQNLSIFLCMMLIAATACMASGCNGKAMQEAPTTENGQQETTVVKETTASGETQILGVGNTQFMLTVVDDEGIETQFEIHTDKQTVGEALLDSGLVEGDNGEYGLYIKKVNGIEADYDKNGTYWAFYIDGEYAMTGVDATDITEGSTYSLKVEK